MSRAPATEALQGLLRDLPTTLPLHRIDRVWLFAPREIAGRESGLVVLTLAPEDGADGPHQLLTVQYQAERGKSGIRRTDTLTEQGWAPADRIPGVIHGVLRRLGDDSEDPREETIGGDERRWHDLLHSLGATPVDPARQE